MIRNTNTNYVQKVEKLFNMAMLFFFMLAVPYVPRAGIWELSLCPPHRGSPSQNSRILDPPPGPDLQPVKKMRKFSQRQPENFLKASPPFVRRKLLNKLGTRITFSSRHLI